MKKGIFLPTVLILSLVIFISVGFVAIKTTKKSYETKIDEKSNFIRNLTNNFEIEKFRLDLLVYSKLNETFKEFYETSNFQADDMFDGYPIWEFGFSKRNPEHNVEGRFVDMLKNKLSGFSINIENNLLHIELEEEREFANSQRTLSGSYKFYYQNSFDISEFLDYYKSLIYIAKECYTNNNIKSCLESKGLDVEARDMFLRSQKSTKYGKIKFAIKLQ